MFRYAALIVGALIIVGYIFFMAARGSISGRFRTVSLILLCLFLVLAGIGVYTTQTQYSVQSVQEEYSARQDDILHKLSSLYAAKEYTRARKLAERYIQVNDPRLDNWYQKAREAELLQHERNLPPSAHKQRLNLYKQLFELTRNETYARRVDEARQALRRTLENKLLQQMNKLPEKALAQQALGYSLLMRLNPDRPLYKQKFRSYHSKVGAKIEASPWSDLCSTREVKDCDHVGFGIESVLDGEPDFNPASSEICGLSWRPKGTLVSRDGRTAPEDGTYYLVHDWKNDLLVLINVSYVHVKNPFPDITHIPGGDESP